MDAIFRHEHAAMDTRSSLVAAKNLTPLLEKNLSSAVLTLLRAASATARALGFSLYAVGGFARDLLLNQPNTFASLSASLDLDLVVEGDAIALAEALQKKFGGRVRAHARFGTAIWNLEAATVFRDANPSQLTHLDFATARREFYAHPSALPDVESSLIKQDLVRRDFTINTLAICLDPERFGDLLDPFGGEADLQRGVIRVLHNLSFSEDPTRILRAARFEARFDFQIETHTAELIGAALEMLPRVSGARVRAELELIFAEREPGKSLARLQEFGALKIIFARLEFSAWHAAQFRAQPRASALTYLGLLAFYFSADDAAEFGKRLALTNAETQTLIQVGALNRAVTQISAPDLAPSAIVRALENYSDAALEIFARGTDDARAVAHIARYRDEWRLIAAELNGDDLKRMGIPPSPRYREILTRLRDARLDGRVSSRAEEEDYVQQISAEWNRSIAR